MRAEQSTAKVRTLRIVATLMFDLEEAKTIRRVVIQDYACRRTRLLKGDVGDHGFLLISAITFQSCIDAAFQSIAISTQPTNTNSEDPVAWLSGSSGIDLISCLSVIDKKTSGSENVDVVNGHVLQNICSLGPCNWYPTS